MPEIAVGRPAPTYCKDVAPIIQKNCQECHRPGQVGPFPLETYEQARNGRRILPPSSMTGRCRPGKRRRTSVPSSATSARFPSRKSPRSSPGPKATRPKETRPTCPPRPSFRTSGSWARPTWFWTPAPTSKFPQTGEDIYRCFVVPTGLTEDKYVSAVEFRAGNRSVVHHILAYVDVSGKARERERPIRGRAIRASAARATRSTAAWAAGRRATGRAHLDEGIGRSLPGKSDVIIQVHYHPRGKAETDRSKIGIYFARKPVKQIAALERA